MHHEAQNAFLKLLEEPVENVSFILTAHEPQLLLPTILSRVQHIELGKISHVASESLLRAHHVSAATALQQMLFIASGLPAELVRLADDKQYFEEKASLVRQARDFLTAGVHARLTLISHVSGREDALLFVSTVAAVLRFTSERDPAAAGTASAEVLETVTSRLNGNGHVRTQLMYLALNVV
jgi:DNA polymerase-3 subunit delta'